MSRTLSPYNICQIYTLEEITAKVATYQDASDGAVIKEYSKDTTQGRQDVESADMDKIESVLAVWIQALAMKKGLTGTRIVSQNFGGHH